MRNCIGLDELKRVLDYSEDSGLFKWKVAIKGRLLGEIAGCKNSHGYWQIKINKKIYMAHRLAWLYVHGKMPIDQVDHIDGNKTNNSISNLRECNARENGQNRASEVGSTSKYLGVSFESKKGKWRADISVNGKNKFLGHFCNEEDAFNAYCEYKKIIHRFSPTVRG